MDARPPFFAAKKWTLMIFCTIQIIVMIIFAALSSTLVDKAMENIHDENKNAVRGAAIGLIIGSSVISILFQLLGLLGAWKENFCMSCTYAVLSALGLLFGFYRAFTSPIYWLTFVISLIVTIVAVLFTIDLRKIRLGLVPQMTTYPNY